MVAIPSHHLDHLRGRRAEHRRFYIRELALHQTLQARFERQQTAEHLLFDLTDGGYHGDVAHRRTAERFAGFHLTLVEFFVILPRGGQNDRMQRAVRLYHGAAGVKSAACAPDHLRDERKRALTGAVVLCVQALVGIEHADQRDVLEIQSLCHHLRADEDVRLALAEPGEQALMRALGVHGVRIHAEHPRGREPLVQLLLQLLRAGRFGEQARAAALRAFAGYLDGSAAVVAHRAAGNRMVGHRGRAGRALRHPAAHAAADHAAVAAPVEEQDSLFALFERADELAFQIRPDDAAPSLAGQSAHIRDDDLGQSGAQKTLCERKDRVFSLFRAVIGFHRRRGRAEHEQRIRLGNAVLRHIAGMIARRLLRAVGRILLLVDDDNTEVFRGREHRRARTDDNAGAAGLDLFEAVVPLTGGQRRVQHSDLLAKPGGKLAQQLRCQPDLRHEHDGALSLLQRVRDELEIHLCLAAARHAEQERGARRVLVQQSGHAVIRLLLCGREHGRSGTRHLGEVRRAQHLLVFRAEDALFHHVAQRGIAHAGHVAKLLLAHRAAVRQQRDHIQTSRAPPADARHRLGLFHSQTEHFLGLIAGFLHGIAVINENPLSCQRIQRLACAFAEAFAYLGG